MAANPMQRKTRNAFLGGFLIALLLGGIGIFFLYTQLQDAKKEKVESEEIALQSTTMAYVVSNPVQSGERLRDNIQYMEVTNDAVPANAVTSEELAQYIVKKDVEATNYTVGSLLPDEMVAKIKLEAGTVLTRDMIITNDNEMYKFVVSEDPQTKERKVSIIKNSSYRMVEYNMLVLPTKLMAGEYIDIRLQMPTGEDFIVISKKYVEDTDASTVWLKMSEEEILTLNSAIVEAYIMKGAKLYANTYIVAGEQDEAAVTYIPTKGVRDLISNNPNVIADAKAYLRSLYNNENLQSIRNQSIGNTLKIYEDEALGNVEEGMGKEIEQLRATRQKYMEELNAYGETTITDEY